LLPGFIWCCNNEWGSPFRITEEADGPYRVTWFAEGLGRRRPRPAGWARPRFSSRREAQLAVLSELLRWLSHADQADVVARIVERLRGKDLACHCGARTPCHVDVLLFIAKRGAGPGECDLPSYPTETRP
jgi:hypothetical protein